MQQTLGEIYQELVNAGKLSADPAQSDVLTALQLRREFIETQTLQNHPHQNLTSLVQSFFKPTQPKTIKGLYIWGGVGRGKSMLMDLFVNHTNTPKKRRVHFHAFMQEVHHQMHEARKAHVNDPLDLIAQNIIEQTSLLAFDEMQITDITDAMLVGRFFEKLFAAGVVIVTTSNRPPSDLYKDGLNRGLFLPFIDMLYDKLDVIELAGPTDHRQERLRDAQVYFYPIRGAKAKIDLLWHDLTAGNESHPLKLTVNGRLVEISAFANGVGRASFSELCATPLGPADYLAIAGALRVLILEDIPKLSINNYNEAKRFVTLIDALYEARVRLICSAAASPDHLYIEGAGSFEFARTASRLNEMQSTSWGS